MKRKLFIDCVTHALTGPAILRAAGINKDGTVADADERGLPHPVSLIMLPDQEESKISTIRVAISSEAKSHHIGRTFEVSFNNPIPAEIAILGHMVPVAFVGMHFPGGGFRETVNRVIHNMQQTNRSLL